MDVISKIHQLYPALSPKQRQLADYILREGAALQNMNISILAKHSGVSNGTITHFCQATLGCGSYAELKLELSRTAASETRDPDNFFDAVFSYYEETVQRTDQMIDRAALSQLVRTIENCQGKVYVYGIGSSGLTASELMLRLLRMGIDVAAVTDAHLMIIESVILKPQDLVLALSISGETSEVVQATRAARAAGCQTTCMTSFPDSPLGRSCHMCIPVINTERIGKLRYLNTQFSSMYVVDLITAMLLENSDRLGKMERTVHAIIAKKHVIDDDENN